MPQSLNSLSGSKHRPKRFITASAVADGIVAVDLFCGAGGLTKGLEKAGIDVALGIDIDPACEFPYAANNKAKFLLKSVKELRAADLKKAYGDATFTLLAGCAPCQPFSKYRLGKSDESDGRWNLLQEFQRLVLQVKPTMVTMENVPRLAEQDIFAEFAAALEDAGYLVHCEIVRCADYGVPQQRERLVLLASKLGSLTLSAPTHARKPRTVRQSLAGLPPLPRVKNILATRCIRPRISRRSISAASKPRNPAAHGAIGTQTSWRRVIGSGAEKLTRASMGACAGMSPDQR